MPRTDQQAAGSTSGTAVRRIRLRDDRDVGNSVSQHHLPTFDRGKRLKWSVEVISDAERVDQLETDWRRFTPEDAAPFLTFSWNRAWFRTFGESCGRPSIFRICENGKTVAILPCYRKGNVFRLAGDNVCDYQDIVARDDDSAKMALATVLLWMKQNAKNCHFHFEKLSTEGLLHRTLAGKKGNPGFLSFVKHYAPCPYVDLQGGLENYLASLPRKMRGDLRRALNRLDREAPCARVTICRDFNIGVRDLESAAAFHVQYFRKGGASPLDDPRLVSLLGEVAKDPDVGLHLSHFTDQSETLAVDFGFARGGRYYGYLAGFNPDFRKIAPGKCLLLSRIDQWVATDGVEVLDFLAGDEEYKKGFTGGESYQVNSVRLMPDGFSHRCLRFYLEGDKRMRAFAKLLLKKTGCLA